ncbi:MAG TPA: LysR family transcriptional regulator [Actinomycetales bacterium]|nr:LysR family transcriptional regulator [Actinomycetales bacterium]
MSLSSRDFTIDLRRLRVLRELEQRGTVSATGDALHLTPSAVSQQIAGLARDLGVPLLEKQGRGVRLTGQARVLLRHADAVQERLELARADLAAWGEGDVGEVRVGALSTAISALVAPCLARLRSERPRLTLRVTETDPPDALTRLDSGDLDIVLAADFRDAPSLGDPRYHRVDLLTDRMDAVLPEGHRLADPAGVRLEQLASEPWVASDVDNPCSQITVAVCASAGFSPDVRHHCLEWDAVAALVAAGAGVALIPRLAQPLRQKGLSVCPVLGAPASRRIYAAVRGGAQNDPGTAAVLACLEDVARCRPDAVLGMVDPTPAPA